MFMEDIAFKTDQTDEDYEHAGFCKDNNCKHNFCYIGKKVIEYAVACKCGFNCILCHAFMSALVAHARKCDLVTCEFPKCSWAKQELLNCMMGKNELYFTKISQQTSGIAT